MPSKHTKVIIEQPAVRAKKAPKAEAKVNNEVNDELNDIKPKPSRYIKKDWSNVEIPEGFAVNPKTNRLVKIDSRVYKKLKNEQENGAVGEVLYEGANAAEVKKNLKVKTKDGQQLIAKNGKVQVAHKPKKDVALTKATTKLAMEIALENQHLLSSGQLTEEQFEDFIIRNVQQRAIDPNHKSPKGKKVVEVAAAANQSAEHKSDSDEADKEEVSDNEDEHNASDEDDDEE